MTNTQNNRLRTASRIPVCYPVMFQTGWHIDEVGLLTLSQPRFPIESSRCLIADEYVRLRGFEWSSQGSNGQNAIGSVWHFPRCERQPNIDYCEGFYA
jgi:hypothetical protein